MLRRLAFWGRLYPLTSLGMKTMDRLSAGSTVGPCYRGIGHTVAAL